MGKARGHMESVRFNYNPEKSAQAVAYLLQKAGGSLGKLKLVKLAFYADREHLFRFGRPILGGSYVAMPLGPVPSELLNEIDGNLSFEEKTYELQGITVTLQSPYPKKVLSESDLKTLDKIWKRYGKMTGGHLCDLTHKLKAYKETYQPKGSTRRQFPLPYESFFSDTKNKAMLDIIREDQEAEALLS